jgi:1-acyl-sn-glycerol-3-phosphate acyltransferase
MAERSLHSRLWYELLRRCLQLGGVLAYRVRYYGRENIPANGGVLVVSNHQSHFDPPLVGMGVPRRMNYLARDTLFRFAPLGWLIHSVDAIPIDREGVGLSGIKESLRRLKRGEMLMVFPEGTRSRDGEIARFRPGFTALAVRSGASILPAAVEGSFAAWPRERKWPGPGRIGVQYGPPIPPEEIRGRDERDQLELRHHPAMAGDRRPTPL